MAREFKTEWETEAYEKAMQLMEDLGNLSSTMGGGRAAVQGLLDGFVRQHRTLQQSIVRNFMGMLTQWAEGEKVVFVDDRNAAAWDFAQHMREDGCYLPNI